MPSLPCRGSIVYLAKMNSSNGISITGISLKVYSLYGNTKVKGKIG
jgi:hypothetical protein